MRAIPFLAMHFACPAVLRTCDSPIAGATAAALYAVRMFAIAGFHDRYFSHRTFRAARCNSRLR